MSKQKHKIDQPIVGFSIKETQEDIVDESVEETTELEMTEPATEAELEFMHEQIARPEVLHGSTYKISSPTTDYSMYVTINDIVLNENTDHELHRPFEIFVNSKNMDQFQWIVALTRVISAMFRKGGDVAFLVEELRSVFDPKGGYFKPGGRYIPSLIAELGDVVEKHLKSIGYIKDEEMDPHMKAYIDGKKAAAEAKRNEKAKDEVGGKEESEGDGVGKYCHKCHENAVIILDGCPTCTSCGDSKCG